MENCADSDSFKEIYSIIQNKYQLSHYHNVINHSQSTAVIFVAFNLCLPRGLDTGRLPVQ